MGYYEAFFTFERSLSLLDLLASPPSKKSVLAKGKYWECAGLELRSLSAQSWDDITSSALTSLSRKVLSATKDMNRRNENTTSQMHEEESERERERKPHTRAGS